MSDSVNNYMSVSPSDLALIVEKSYALNKPVMVWGPPGQGKTTIVEDTAKKLGVPCLTVALTLFDPVDLNI